MEKKNFLVGNEISFSTVRVNGQVLSTYEAKKIAKENEKDLILINDKTNPPICIIEEYNKYLYSLKMKEKEKKKPLPIKEVQLSANIAENDLLTKEKAVSRFLSEGHKVRVILKLKGRELTRVEESSKSLYQLISDLEEVAVPEALPKKEEKNISVILKKK